MEEVGGAFGGEWDYAKLRGGTGPLVYPAGFVYLYGALWWLTDWGADVRLAQYIFLGLYLCTVAAAMLLYHRSRAVPQWVMLLLEQTLMVLVILLLVVEQVMQLPQATTIQP